jgi:hypothetical protein
LKFFFFKFSALEQAWKEAKLLSEQELMSHSTSDLMTGGHLLRLLILLADGYSKQNDC